MIARILICGWTGSTNLGDELVLAGLARLLEGNRMAAVSVDPPATWEKFRLRAFRSRDVRTLVAAVREADLLVFGGGGLLQDETSPFNLPYHLLRPALGLAAGTPVVGVGLGAGPLDRAGSRTAVRVLGRARAISVRDEASRRLLADCGLRARVGADLGLALDPVDATPEDVITVALRPWGGGGLLPVGARGSHDLPDRLLDVIAGQLDALQADTGWPIRFVALQADRDDDVHARVAARMASPTGRVRPGVHTVVDEVAAGRLVVAMRYHAGISAVLGGRPAVLLGYSPKVEALAGELGDGGRLLPVDVPGLGGLAAAASEVVDRADPVVRARSRLRARLDVDRQVIAEGLRAAGRA